MKRLNQFSYNEPSTFHFADDQQRAYLREVYESEASLDHLPDNDRDIVEEAVRFSGVEVHNECIIQRRSNAAIRAFFGRWRPTEHRFYHPDLGEKNVQKTEDVDGKPFQWQEITVDLTEFPYPFAEPQVVPKAIPVNLSSIQVLSRNDDRMALTASPSALLVAKIPNDNIIKLEDLAVEFDVDFVKRRVLRQTLYLREPIKVYRGIKLNEMRFEYEFAEDPVSGRNIAVHMQQVMRGRLWWTFRPTLTLNNDISVKKCLTEPATESYLYASFTAIDKHLR